MTKRSLNKLWLKSLWFVLLLSISVNSVFSQNNTSELSTEISQTENQSSTSAAENSTWNWNNSDFTQNQNQPSSIGLFFRMFFALAIVLALAYFAVKFLKRTTKLSNSDDPFLRHVSHLALSASRSVDVVTILDHAYILGVSDNSVNLIGQIDDKELVDSMNLYADKNDNTKRPRSFNDILNIFMQKSGQTGKTENIYGSSAWNASEMLRRQRERMNSNSQEEEQ